MNKNMATLLVLVLAVIAGIMVYQQMTEPRTMGKRMGDAMHSLQQGDFGQAVDDMNNRTPTDQMQDSINDAVDSMQNQ